MHLLHAQNDIAHTLNQRLVQLNLLLFKDLPPPTEQLTLQPGEALDAKLPKDHWAWLVSGSMHGVIGERGVVEYEHGDLVGLTNGYALPDFGCIAQQSSLLNVYNVGDVLRHLHLSKQRAAQWTAYLLTQLSYLQQAIQVEPRDDASNHNGFLSFAPGEVMIHEGELAGEVYHVVEGHADVYRGETKVGEVLPGELFGAMAMLCGTPRTATVIARDDMLVAVVPQADFRSLIARHPETAVILLENMARAINDLNDRLREAETAHEASPA
ncbi:cyclic nucleotide-binding domain-containing protein [Salinispirillum marinum]|uniref:Cyclic nucleotide-binding domain-containing protein n=2 Tax=Saccharospirillaceae TaxID=255527 RepID=A0ABV8BDB1_9GAMM